MKCLIYCTKSKWRMFFDKIKNIFSLSNKKSKYDLNGKIVAEFDGEVEEIEYKHIKERDNLGMLHNETWYEYRGLNIGHYDCELSKKSCLSLNEIFDYLDNKNGYAIHINNLNVFEEPKMLSDYFTLTGTSNNLTDFKPIERAPQNMMFAYELISELNWGFVWDRCLEKKILISIRPEWACKILNGEKTIEVRKQMLNCMKGKDY